MDFEWGFNETETDFKYNVILEIVKSIDWNDDNATLLFERAMDIVTTRLNIKLKDNK